MKHRSPRTPKPRRNGASQLAEPSAAEMDEAVALFGSGQWDRLEAVARRLVARYPDHAFGWHVMALALESRGLLPGAVNAASRAVRLAPHDAGMHRSLGNALKAIGLLDAAEASYRRSLEIEPDHLGALNNLGNVLRELNRHAEAEAVFRRALEIEPRRAGVHNNLGIAIKYLGRYAEAEASFRRALEIEPGYVEARSNLLFSLNYQDYPPEVYRDEAVEYGRAVSQKVRERFSAWSCTERPERLRVGLVSGDLCRHPVGYFLEGVLARLDPARIELLAYPTAAKGDDLTDRLRPRFAGWRPLVGLDDEAAAHRIHDDGIHVLVDLSGHTTRNRLPVFARRPAPVQATWLGYSASTGLSEMDWLIADPHVAPPEEDWQFTERVWRLPESYLCFTPPDVAVEVDPLPALSSRAVTFCSFNNLMKMNDAVVALWARVLRAVPASRLFLKAGPLGESAVREATVRRFEACGIGAERLLLEGTVPRREDHFAAYNRMDIALDPFPYTGTTTSVEALWMGVPLLTKRGDRFLSHVGESIAHNAGLSDWIAIDDDDYVAKAAAFATDLDRLAALRGGLRERVLASPLFDAPRFARHFEDALWGMWEGRGQG